MRPDLSIFTVNPTRTPAQLRREGFLILPLGLFICAGSVGMLALALGWQIPPEWLPASTHIDPRATPWEPPVGAVAFLSGVLLFGVIAVTEGLWRIFLGRINTVLLRTMLVLAAIFFFVGSIASMMLGRRYGQVGQ